MYYLTASDFSRKTEAAVGVHKHPKFRLITLSTLFKFACWFLFSCTSHLCPDLSVRLVFWGFLVW